MKLTLGEILKIAKEIEDKLYQVRTERSRNITVSYPVGEQPEWPETTIAEYTNQMYELHVKARTLRGIAAKANLTTMIDFEENGRNLTLAEGLLLLTFLLKEREQVQVFAGNEQKTKRNIGWQTTAQEIVELTYDRNEMKAKLKEMEAQIRKLRIAVDKANINTEFEIEDTLLDY